MSVLWGEFRKKHPKVLYLLNTLDTEDKRQIQKNKFLRLLVLCFTTIVLCYTLYPFIYKNFIPIQQLDTPYINLLGLITLCTSLVWLVIAQVDFDKELYNIHGAGNGVSYIDISAHSKRISIGYFLMFIGVTVTLANILSAILLISAFVVYRRK
ncbi:MAG: hypothetical protein EOP51_09750 [Sphingobacteriales bacterium]|nr:MAG: hypothetical protein EOP51_09750 [Sphingobacteriales bacterium]